MRFEDPQGNGNDTAANGLRLMFCDIGDWGSNQKTIEIYGGEWGDWKGMKMCPDGYFIDGAMVRYKGKQGSGDDTALNGLKIHCRGYTHSTKSTNGNTSWVTVYEGNWGSWKFYVGNSEKFVKAAQIQFEGSDASDDTAWNGLQFRSEYPSDGLSRQAIQGSWRLMGSGPKITYQLEHWIQTSNSKSLTRTQMKSLTTTVEAGIEFEGVGSLKTTISETNSREVAKQVSSTITLTQREIINASCGERAADVNNWFVWQWVMEQDKDDWGEGVSMKTNHFRCTDSSRQPPRCPMGFCQDSFCQVCDGSCGGGMVGNDICSDGSCCSSSGLCGTSSAYCS